MMIMIKIMMMIKNYDNANDDSGDQTICHAMHFNRA